MGWRSLVLARCHGAQRVRALRPSTGSGCPELADECASGRPPRATREPVARTDSADTRDRLTPPGHPFAAAHQPDLTWSLLSARRPHPTRRGTGTAHSRRWVSAPSHPKEQAIEDDERSAIIGVVWIHELSARFVKGSTVAESFTESKKQWHVLAGRPHTPSRPPQEDLFFRMPILDREMHPADDIMFDSPLM
jgi:hypothetical protein